MTVKNQLMKCFDMFRICGLATLIAITSCSQKENRLLQQALNLSGANKPELEKVLKHYENDILKLEAAKFLISNMPGQYALKSSGIDSCQKIIKEAVQIGYVGMFEKQKGQQFLQSGKDTIYDINVITADYLIENIDLSFDVWKKNKWNNDLSFDDFCEFILPYRIADEELSNWRVKYRERYAPVLDSLYAGTDAVAACDSLCEYMKKEGFLYNTDFSPPHLSGDFLLNNRFGTCRDGCDIGIYAMRAVGIPVATDILPYSPEHKSGHSWNVLLDVQTKKQLPFWYTQFSPERNDNFTDERKKGKVYRMCYGIQSDSNYPDRRNRRMKDVTAEYFGNNQTHVKVEIPNIPKNAPVYLGVFSPSGWKPVCSGKYDKKRNKAVFDDLEPRVIYQPLVFDGRKLRPANHPFLLHAADKIHYFIPKIQDTHTIHLTRKYPLKQRTADFRHSMLGATIEGSTDSLFHHSVRLHTIADTIRSNHHQVSSENKTPHRYVRYRSASGKRTEMGEIIFLREDGTHIPIKNISVNARMHRPVPHHNTKNIIDGDPLSFYSHHEAGLTVLFEFTQPESVHSIVFIPRNDDNFIRVGDEYELFYNSGTSEWISLGTQEAASFVLTYDNVPKNALLWLKNKTRGREEQVFTYENNRQRFGTFDEYEKKVIVE